jgi:hypothetical protein
MFEIVIYNPRTSHFARYDIPLTFYTENEAYSYFIQLCEYSAGEGLKWVCIKYENINEMLENTNLRLLDDIIEETKLQTKKGIRRKMSKIIEYNFIS